MDGGSMSDFEDDIGDVTGVPEWYLDVYRENLWYIHSYYNRLYLQIITNKDANALEYGLLRLPILRRVTITPATHGVPGRPLYPTPTIRSLHGLVYPLERSWPVMGGQWRGYLLVSRILAQHLRNNPGSKVTNLIVDTNQLRTGISCRIFDGPDNNNERSDLITILSQPGFPHLDLSLHCAALYQLDGRSFRSGHLRNLLAMAPDPQHISLYTNIAILEDPNDDEDVERYVIPLRSIFPINDWHQLRHFGLSRFHVKKDDVIEFLGELPMTVMSVELSFLIFLLDYGDYHALLQDMRKMLGWRKRKAADQPKITVRVDEEGEEALDTLRMDVSREVVDFMYHDGENLFVEDEGFTYFVEISQGTGIRVDVFGPDYK
ncbi:unnamed protein product [Fusarium venenatum]|uniref:F-box domain-containing protein n=1 Tax=Fusarium venenatum TaxID=56646 RepID=A0A2L2U307_9HYPO|nr:uncharacterized protein FVRRES_09032 [Fusarium venenatum]CEI68955.1 unnamed protein product [Fusarium venenatum]